jgi:hypothetical protein
LDPNNVGKLGNSYGLDPINFHKATSQNVFTNPTQKSIL